MVSLRIEFHGKLQKKKKQLKIKAERGVLFLLI